MRNADEVIPGVTLFEVKRRRAQIVMWRAYGVATREEFDALHVSDEEVAKSVKADKREVRVGVTVSLIRTARGLKGTWYHFGVDNREAFDALRITDEQIADYLLANRRTKEEAEFTEVEFSAEVSGMRRTGKNRGTRRTGIDLRSKWEEKVKEYQSAYEITTPNDMAAIRTMAWINVQLEYWQKTIIELSGATDIKVRNRVGELNKQITAMMQEDRALQKLLEIDKAGRQHTDESGIDAVADMVKDADWLLENEVQEITHKCEDGKVIEIGWMWHFFPTHPPRPASSDGRADKYLKGEVLFKQECPNCGKITDVVFRERGIALSARDFDIPELRQLVG